MGVAGQSQGVPKFQARGGDVKQPSVDPRPGAPRDAHHPECSTGFPKPGCHPECPTKIRCMAVLAGTYRPQRTSTP
jgi:hypothetical protein